MKNGLYSVHVDMLDGDTGKGSGVLIFRDGNILGGNAFLYYVGDYSFSGDSLKGSLIINQHTPSPDAHLLFGGREVSIGFSGKFTAHSVDLNGSALVGKISKIFKGTMRWLADAG